jgi:AcrR family transcriptional regulator
VDRRFAPDEDAMRPERHRARRLRHAVDQPAELRDACTDRFVERRARRHRETRDEILLAAREVLLERGATDLSLREIARRAGFSPGALYKYFDSKDDMVKALADRAMGALLEARGAVTTEMPPDERAVEIAMAYLEFARHNPEDVAVVTMHESVAVGPHSAEHERLEETVLGVFREGAASGIFRLAAPEDAEFMTYGAWALAQGLATLEQRQRPTTAARLRKQQRRLLWAFVNGLKSEPPAPPATEPAPQAQARPGGEGS